MTTELKDSIPALEIRAAAANVCIRCTKEDEITQIHALCNDMHKWMFIGNGHEAWTLRMDRVERVISIVIWVFGILGSSAVLSVAGIAFYHLFKVRP